MVWREDYEVIVEAVQGSRRVEGGWCSEGGARAEAAGARAGQAAPVDARPPHSANCPPLHPQADPGIIIPRQQIIRILHIQGHTFIVHISEQSESRGSAS